MGRLGVVPPTRPARARRWTAAEIDPVAVSRGVLRGASRLSRAGRRAPQRRDVVGRPFVQPLYVRRLVRFEPFENVVTIFTVNLPFGSLAIFTRLMSWPCFSTRRLPFT